MFSGQTGSVDWTPSVRFGITSQYLGPNSETKYYIDGSQQGTTQTVNTGGINYSSDARFTIGVYRYQGANYNVLNGVIDQVRFFNKEASSSEITTLSGETHASTTKATTDIFSDSSGKALYQLDGNANDTSGSNNGTATNVVYQEATKFSPDLVWIKARTGSANSHMWQNSVRGANKTLLSNSTSVELTSTDFFTSFDSNGFTLPPNAGTQTNQNGTSYVSWCFNAGTNAAASNTDGTSITSTVKANTAAGFSIVSYTAGSSKDYTEAVGHGLDSHQK